uniref:Uncharacterized protein n=2 Tax=Rhizophagus irregularis TaxID=588596 RepID=U9UH81_RHIID
MPGALQKTGEDDAAGNGATHALSNRRGKDLKLVTAILQYMSLRICQYQNKNCGCQNYLNDQDNPEKCYYCGHFNAFHSGFSNETSNLGVCQQNSAHCGCEGLAKLG